MSYGNTMRSGERVLSVTIERVGDMQNRGVAESHGL